MKPSLASPNALLTTAVISSVVLHGLVIASSFGLISFNPQYGVTQAPSSVEIQLVEESPKPVLQANAEEVLTAELETKTHVLIKKEEPEPVQEVKKTNPAPIVPQSGAVRKEAEAYMDNPAPVYPEKARLRGWEGLVILAVNVDAGGNVTQVQIENSSGHEILDQAAVKAVQNWRFKPAGVGSVTFSSTVRIPVRFKLTDA